MAVEFIDDSLIVFHVPNTEAPVNGQHYGCKDTSVGAYYMSEMQDSVEQFLNEFNGDFYMDLAVIYFNGIEIVNKLKELKLEEAFKMKLKPQEGALDTIKAMLKKCEYLFKMPNPSVNEKRKYLKLDNLNNTVNLLRDLCLGELCDLCFKKVGDNGFIVYLQKSPNFEDTLSRIAYKWIQNND